jgi:hypothetical protein
MAGRATASDACSEEAASDGFSGCGCNSDGAGKTMSALGASAGSGNGATLIASKAATPANPSAPIPAARPALRFEVLRAGGR